jgi:hypothetical protein
VAGGVAPVGPQGRSQSHLVGCALVVFFLVMSIWFAFKPYSVVTEGDRTVGCGSSVASVYRGGSVPVSSVPCLSEAQRRQGYAIDSALAAGVALTVVVGMALFDRHLRSRQTRPTRASPLQVSFGGPKAATAIDETALHSRS